MDQSTSAKYASRVVEAIRHHLANHHTHLARIVIGPRREGWFNAESFVAVNSSDTGFAAYGEQEYDTILSNVGYPQADENGQQRPDLVGYNKYVDDHLFIIEAKVVYNADNPSHLSATFSRLNDQCHQARIHFPQAAVIGVIYVVMIYNINLGERLDDGKTSWAERRVIMSNNPEILDPTISRRVAASDEVAEHYSGLRIELSTTDYFERVTTAIDGALPVSDYDWVTANVASIFENEEKIDTQMAHPAGTLVSVGIAAKMMHL